jgi:Na+-driven multidrug efflux pump
VRIASLLWLVRIAQEAAGAGRAALLDGVNVAQRIDMAAVFVALGWGAAATTVVGQNLGAGRTDRARRAAWWMTAHATISTVCAVAVFWWFREDLFSAIEPGLPNDARRAGEAYWRCTLPALPALAIGAVLARALNGALDVRTPLFIDAAWYLLVLPIAAGLASGAGVAGFGATPGPGDPEAAWRALAVVHGGAAATYVAAFLLRFSSVRIGRARVRPRAGD